MSEFGEPLDAAQLAAISAAPTAARLAVASCRGGCPVIVFYDRAGEVMACAHIPADELEIVIAELRAMRDLGAALRRPPA